MTETVREQPVPSPLAETPLQRQSTLAELMKNWSEVFGLVVGGFWILITFGLKECPTRVPNFEQTSNLSWGNGPTSDTCRADWDVSLKNISTRVARVKYVRVIVWPLTPPTPQGDRPGYVDFRSLRPDSKAYLFDKEFENPPDPFVDRYAPNGADRHTFEFIFNRKSNVTWVAFELALYQNKDDKEPVWYSYDWGKRCYEEPPNPSCVVCAPQPTQPAKPHP